MTTSFDSLPLMLTVKDLAAVMGIALPLAYDLVKQNGFPSIKVSDRRIIIPRDALQRWIDQQTGGAA